MHWLILKLEWNNNGCFIFQIASNKGADQTARVRRLVFALVPRIQLRLVFSRHDPYDQTARVRRLVFALVLRIQLRLVFSRYDPYDVQPIRSRPPEKMRTRIFFFISQPKLTLWVLKITVSMRRFF